MTTSLPKKTNLFGTTVGASNTNPFHSTNGEIKSSYQGFTNKNNPLHSDHKPAFPSSTIKYPFGQPQAPANGVISQAQANASIMLGNATQGLITSQSNPFAHIDSQTNTGFLPASTPKTSTVPFKPQEQNMVNSTTKSFFNKPAISTAGTSSQMSTIFNKAGTNQQATTGLFTNTQNGLTNSTSPNKIFTPNNNIFSQSQTQTGNFPKAIFNNNSQTQQTASYGQTQNPFAYNTQPTNNIFNNSPQNKTSQNIFSNNQTQNNFTQQQQPTGFNQQTQMQPNIDIGRAVSQYFQQYKQNLMQRHPFQQSLPTQPYTPQTDYQFNPQQQNADYYLFLNSLVNNEAVRKNATPREIFEFAERWISQISQHKQQQNLTAEQEETKKEIVKLFDLKIDPTLYEMRMKELPPLQFTIEMLQKMNDPFSCKMIVSQLWLRLKERFYVIMNSVRSIIPDSGCIKIKELPYYNEMLVMRKQLQSMVQKVRQLKQKDKQIMREKYDHGVAIKTTLQKYKNVISEANINNKMLDGANEDLEKIIDYIEKNLKTLFKAYIEKEPISIQDPDQFMIEINQRISSEMTTLSRMVDDHLAIENNGDQTIDFLELAENVCNFYEEIATKLYTVREKMKKMIQIVAQYRSYGSYQQLQSKIEEKAKAVLDQKMAVYNCIRDIEEILDAKFQVDRDQNKKESPGRSRLSNKKMLSLQEIKIKCD